MTPDEWVNSLDLARDFAVTSVRGQLHHYPALRPGLNRLVERAIEEATAIAEFRHEWPDIWPGRVPFARWFCVIAYRESLRYVLTEPVVWESLTSLHPEQRQILLWLYVEQMLEYQIATGLRTTAQEVRRRGQQALAALRNQLAVRLGEANDAFPLYPAGVGLPMSRAP